MIKSLQYLGLLWSVIVTIHCSSVHNLVKQDSGLQTTTFAALDSLMQTEKRKVLVFLKTTWCSYCENMELTSFENEQVIKLLDDSYYYIPFDAEQRNPVHFMGKTYNFLPNGRNSGVHELAQTIGTINGQLAYPTIVVLNEDYAIIFQHNSFLSGEELLQILKSLKDKR